MKLRTGRSTYKLPPYHQIVRICIHDKADPWRQALYQSNANDRRQAKPARPLFFVLVGHDKIEFRPTPDKPYIVGVLFSGPSVILPDITINR